MTGETNLDTLIKTMKPELHSGEYVFCTVTDLSTTDLDDTIFMFKEKEAVTILVNKGTADQLHLEYSFIASWITLTVHSSLEAIGLTAAFSKALSDNGISCNVVAAFYHDHIFVHNKDAEKAMATLMRLSA